MRNCASPPNGVCVDGATTAACSRVRITGATATTMCVCSIRKSRGLETGLSLSQSRLCDPRDPPPFGAARGRARWPGRLGVTLAPSLISVVACCSLGRVGTASKERLSRAGTANSLQRVKNTARAVDFATKLPQKNTRFREDVVSLCHPRTHGRCVLPVQPQF